MTVGTGTIWCPTLSLGGCRGNQGDPRPRFNLRKKCAIYRMQKKPSYKMENIQLYEDFKSGTMKSPSGFLSKMAQSAKHAMGMETKEDREALDSMHNAIKSSTNYNWVTNVRELRPGVVVARINNNSVLVDKNAPEIIYKGKELDLHNLQDEAEYLYTKLMNI